MSQLPSAVTRTSVSGMVSTVDHLATGVGVDLLRRGGSAADAAVGANAVLAVTSPHMCGPGGDVWALVHEGGDGPPVALDAAGFAGSGADPDRLRAQGCDEMPLHGDVASVTVPGAVDGWLALHDRYGRLPLADVVAEAIRIADQGFAASPLLAERAGEVAGVEGNTDIPAGLRAGAVVRRPGSARALRAIVEQGRDGFYGGEFGEGLLALGAGEYTTDDLVRPIARWVEPVQAEAFGQVLWTVPPTSQGYLTLAGAWIADGLDLGDRDDDRWAHLLIEAASQAAHDRVRVLHEGADGQALVDPERLAPRRDVINPERAGNVAAPAAMGDTTYLCAVDGDGMGVSLINSNANGFGALLVAGGTGIFLHDRGLGFNLVHGHPAEYGPGRRPPHTLSPALVTNPDGTLRQVLGTMGGDSQPQILLQLLARTLGLGQSPGAAIRAPRWVLTPDDREAGFATWRPGQGRRVLIEDAATGWHQSLAARGHNTELRDESPHTYGHAHLIEVTTQGAFAGAADPRAAIGVAAGL
ncbi:MAG: gamma-glutamyltranspeptidase [Acidimicrobiaceae bacterium]|nr:gamma-glutamyltranspeptidase [Acidimicrobiaceae bacterium]MXZ64501.1 gamma-glutamyltranspeptidase [Acidimicrobiaceae bacterium]MYF33770.1 gamma-glutamyltranspeptidase [Acidimicrobiaceae bacterium]MYG78778.1 gamma-glutamyltranspeptidase [Acidimicrobiaceae bacterium]MYJ85198.1 gamma-glutamyltranspeptidase [Acidimicrobiaceae bacterium]